MYEDCLLLMISILQEQGFTQRPDKPVKLLKIWIILPPHNSPGDIYSHEHYLFQESLVYAFTADQQAVQKRF